MKHFTLTIIAALIAVCSSAGTSKVAFLDSTIIKSNDGAIQTKYVFNYDQSGKKVNESTYIWEKKQNSWLANTNLERKYDEKGNVIEEKNFAWNNKTKQWVSSYLTIFVYDANGNRLLELQYVWDVKVNSWIENYKYEIAYDGNNNQVSVRHYNWDANKEWVASSNSASTTEVSSNYGFTVLTKTACLCE
jgi:hypothetical protein